jgi:hypothetical protein
MRCNVGWPNVPFTHSQTLKGFWVDLDLLKSVVHPSKLDTEGLGFS